MISDKLITLLTAFILNNTEFEEKNYLLLNLSYFQKRKCLIKLVSPQKTVR